MIGFSSANLGISCHFFDPDKNALAKNISQSFYNYHYDNNEKIIRICKKM